VFRSFIYFLSFSFSLANNLSLHLFPPSSRCELRKRRAKADYYSDLIHPIRFTPISLTYSFFLYSFLPPSLLLSSSFYLAGDSRHTLHPCLLNLGLAPPSLTRDSGKREDKAQQKKGNWYKMTHKFIAGRGVDLLTESQRHTLVLFERIGGSISLVAVLMIFVAYALVPRVRNVQNTFIVFASVANIGACCASIIAMDGLELGVASPLCQAQSFMFHMQVTTRLLLYPSPLANIPPRFMQSDPWWSLAMAFNVFLVFFFRAKPDSFRRWWWVYCLICYGGPFAIAIALLLVRNPNRGLVFGQATVSISFLFQTIKLLLADSTGRSGAGLTGTGKTFASTLTICSSGFVLLDLSSSTSWLAGMFSVLAIDSRVCLLRRSGSRLISSNLNLKL
jgi:hypothetical protein